MATYDNYTFYESPWEISGSGTIRIGDYDYKLSEVPGRLTWTTIPPVGTTTLSLNRATQNMGLVAPIGVIRISGLSSTSTPFDYTISLINGQTTGQAGGVTATYDESANAIVIVVSSALTSFNITMGACHIASLGDCTVVCSAVENKSLYESPLNRIPYKNLLVSNMDECFNNCTLLTQAPPVPSGTQSMSMCFMGCTSLVAPPVIPSNVIDITDCFRGCTSLTGDIYILGSTIWFYDDCFNGTTQPIYLQGADPQNLIQMAQTSANNNIYVNVHPETLITFNDTQMNYMDGNELKSLSLQTNANLVQCDVPDLANGGTITTNVNDALIDLYQRRAIEKAGGA